MAFTGDERRATSNERLATGAQRCYTTPTPRGKKKVNV